MSKRHRVSTQEQIRRERQRNAAQFANWCQRTGQSNTQVALILYRVIGRKRYRKSRKGGTR